MNLLTSSRIRDARACLRLDHYKYGIGLRAIGEDAESLTLGRLVHVGLEAWWLDPIDHLTAAVGAIRSAEAEPFAKARAEAMLTGYHVRWAAAQAAYDVLSVEAEFRAPLRNPATGARSLTFNLAGRIDAIVRERESGRVLLVEHKTSSEDITPGSLYWRRLRMDSQVSIYFAGARQLGFDVQGCIYDVLAKPGLRPLQANTRRAEPETPEAYRQRLIDAIAAAPDAYYARGEVARLDTDLAEADADRWALGVALREAAVRGVHPRNPDSCMRYGRVCDFFGLCEGSSSIDDFAKAEPFPELTPKEEAQCQSRP